MSLSGEDAAQGPREHALGCQFAHTLLLLVLRAGMHGVPWHSAARAPTNMVIQIDNCCDAIHVHSNIGAKDIHDFVLEPALGVFTQATHLWFSARVEALGTIQCQR